MSFEGGNVQPWKVLKEQQVFVAEPWIKLSVQQIRLPDGRLIDDYYKLQLQEYVVIVAQTPDQQVIMERQYKHGIGQVSLMLPAGAIEAAESPLAAAQRELLEETGYIADTWRSLGAFVCSANYGCGTAHVFTSQNARQVAEPQSGDLEEMETVIMPIESVIKAIQQGEIQALGSVAAIALALNPLMLSSPESDVR